VCAKATRSQSTPRDVWSKAGRREDIGEWEIAGASCSSGGAYTINLQSDFRDGEYAQFKLNNYASFVRY